MTVDWRSDRLQALGVALVCTLAGIFIADISLTQLDLPHRFNGDGALMYTLAKTMAAHGWYAHNPQLGLPGSMDMADFPMSDHGVFIGMKLFMLLGAGPATATHLYYIMTFFGVGLVTFLTLRRLHVVAPVAFVGALAYTLLPFHFLQGVDSLYLSSYFVVPPALYVLLRLGDVAMGGAVHRRERRMSMAVCVGLTFFGVYYTFFFCYLLLAMTLLDALSRRSVKPLKLGGMYLLVTCTTLFANLSPTWIRWLTDSETHAKISRLPSDTEVFALKLVQMLLPAAGHRLPAFANLAQRYKQSAPFVNENADASLGIVIGMAFVATAIATLVGLLKRTSAGAGDSNPARPVTAVEVTSGGRRRAPGLQAGRAPAPSALGHDAGTLNRAGALFIIAFVYATMGGLSSLFSYTVMSEIRTVCRMVVHLAFLSVLGGGLLAQQAWRHLRLSRGAAAAAVLAVATLIVWDNSNPTFAMNRGRVLSGYAEEQAFFADVQHQAPAGGRIFQMPYVPFPEGDDHGQLRPYWHTEGLSWSHGAVKGSQADLWNAAMNGLVGSDPDDFVRRLHGARFDGVLLNLQVPGVDLDGLERRLAQMFGPAAVRSPDHHFVYFQAK